MLVRSFLRTFTKSLPVYFYSTPPPTNAPAFKFPRRWDMMVDANSDVYDNLAGLTQYHQFANFFKENLNYFTEQHLGYMYQIFEFIDLELDNNFYDIILPITKEYIKKFTFQDTESLSQIIKGCLALKVEDDDFWDLILQKLHKQRCYKYLSIPDVLKISERFLQNPKLSVHPVMSQFSKILDQQKQLFALFSQAQYNKAKALVSQINSHLKSKGPQVKQIQSEVKKIEQL